MKAKYWADNALWSPPGAAIVWLSPLPHGWRHKRREGKEWRGDGKDGKGDGMHYLFKSQVYM